LTDSFSFVFELSATMLSFLTFAPAVSKLRLDLRQIW
jgi:hypothetical protein